MYYISILIFLSNKKSQILLILTFNQYNFFYQNQKIKTNSLKQL